ncbi:MAG: NosD domain-containing protein [Nitrospirota bacterium]
MGWSDLGFCNEVTVYPGGATYTTIQAGINACPVDGTVSVSAGIYTEAVTINKRIAIIGVGTPTIDPPSNGSAVTFDGNGADNASISGFNLTGVTNGYGILCQNNADPIITGNIITNNSGYAVWVAASSYPTLHNNTYSGNHPDAIYMEGRTISRNVTWTGDGAPYVIGGDVIVNSGFTLNIQPNSDCILKFDSGKGLHVSGTLTAIGSSTSKIVFTSINDDTYGGDTNGTITPPAGGDWRSISFKSANAKNSVLDYCIVKYAGNGVNYDGFPLWQYHLC